MLKIHVDLKNVPFERQDERYKAELEIAGAVYDESGRLVGEVSGEKAALSLTAENYVGTVAEGLNLGRSVPLPPGQYQVRLAAREASRSLLGSASQWIEIPDLEAKPLTLSSVFLLADTALEPKPEAKPGDAPERAVVDAQVERVFHQGQGMHYMVHLYTPSKAAPGLLKLQAQVWRGTKLIGVTPTHELKDAPGGRKWSERIELDGFPPGDYELRVVASDPGSGAKAERRVSFRVEA